MDEQEKLDLIDDLHQANNRYTDLRWRVAGLLGKWQGQANNFAYEARKAARAGNNAREKVYRDLASAKGEDVRDLETALGVTGER